MNEMAGSDHGVMAGRRLICGYGRVDERDIRAVTQ